MKIFSAEQIKAWDAYTIQHEPIASINLMERAAMECVLWLSSHNYTNKKFIVFCGPGNNGGDGLAIARLLLEKNIRVDVYLLESDSAMSADCSMNLKRLHDINKNASVLKSSDALPEISKDDIIIDALYGYGLNRPVWGIAQKVVQHINASGADIIAVDMPSGLYADKCSAGNTIINATHTLSFQVMKLAFLLPENAEYTGEVHILDIGLNREYYDSTSTRFEITSHKHIQSLYTPRKKFSHKGTYGNAALIAGSYGMMGAAVLSASACIRGGAGKLTCYIPACGYNIMQIAVPEAMCITDENNTHLASFQFKAKYDAYAIGPGIGTAAETVSAVENLLDEQPKRLIIDADGLNILAANPHLLPKLPRNTILTPHPKEFEKLFGAAANQFERLELALQKAKEMGIYILIKGNYSFMALPDGRSLFNPTGNPGMATGGSGDVLTGILLALYAQYESAERVLLMGVYLHGLAGDVAAGQKTEEAMNAGDIIGYMSQAYAAIKKPVYFP